MALTNDQIVSSVKGAINELKLETTESIEEVDMIVVIKVKNSENDSFYIKGSKGISVLNYGLPTESIKHNW